jgi:hypothetical protein
MLCHDPRLSNEPDHKVETDNPALINAELMRQMFPDRVVEWSEVAKGADYCDEPITLADDLRAEGEELRRRFVHATRPKGPMSLDDAIALHRRMEGDS